ncbi:sulfotransferase [Gammaproteobacteria bacterium]|jgi:hypothetical protein|nr:sulfotransferase [Gammaproteobacteria bacterium]
MNNYSWLQRKLHQVALSSQFMREITFDISSSLSSKNDFTDNHVFVSGLARSGTTVILNAIHASNEFASLSYEDMPFILSPNLWSLFNLSMEHLQPQERAHEDGIKVSTNSPEAFEEVFWKTFNDNNPDSHEKFKIFVSNILARYSKTRYLSKNNQNIRRLSMVGSIYPNSKILVPFRDPIQHAFSLHKQHHNFLHQSENDYFIRNYMEWIGHTEFGPGYKMINSENIIFEDPSTLNHWLEQWLKTYQNCLALSIKTKNLHLVCYETLCNEEKCWENILDIIEINKISKFKFTESKKKCTESMNESLVTESYLLYEQMTSLSV